MKTFKSFITESGLISEQSAYDITDSVIKSRVNAVLGHCATTEYLNPEAAFNQMEAKLLQIGLSRVVVEADAEHEMESVLDFSQGGTHSIGFVRNESFGKTVDTAFDEFDTSSESYTLSLKIEKLETGSFKVYGSLV